MTLHEMPLPRITDPAALMTLLREIPVGASAD
jgi:hypothetical protein